MKNKYIFFNYYLQKNIITLLGLDNLSFVLFNFIYYIYIIYYI